MTKTIFAVAVIAAILITSLIGAQFVTASLPGPLFLKATGGSAVDQNANLAKLSVTTAANIPKHSQDDPFIPANPVVGFAWADTTAGKAFITTIHPAIGRDSKQNPDAWHAHTVTLAGGQTAPNDFCIVSIDTSPTAGIQIQKNTMNVSVQQSDLPTTTSAVNAITGFTVQADGACGSGLAVLIST